MKLSRCSQASDHTSGNKDLETNFTGSECPRGQLWWRVVATEQLPQAGEAAGSLILLLSITPKSAE